MDLQNKTILITGSASGIGKAMAEHFLQKGAKVAISDINGEKLEETRKELSLKGNVVAIEANVAREADVESLMQKTVASLGALDVAILNAGILRDGLLIRVDRETGKVVKKMSLEQWQSVIDVNLTGVFLCGREAATVMAESKKGGVIIPIASVAMHGNPGQTNYSAAKAGVATMTKLWAQELARYKIRVAGIAPGFIATDMVLKDMK
ncbi:MAG: SDR family NAD(P)-dependent oxidoreductase, partial [Leptospiraceae bacterium]|nr:SDR family NAD(P)-dependent oxidoreductase [Leptospiraceae bacterium]